jgi:RNA polymerase sigma-70 factor (ECF subfamily)
MLAALAVVKQPTGLVVEYRPPMAVSSTQAPAAPLLPLVAAGEVEAFRQVIATYGGLILAMARRFNPQEAEDAVQEILIDLWKNAARFDAAMAKETTFVMLIARRRLIDRTRKRNARFDTKRDQMPVIVDEAPQPDIAVEASQAARALDQLGPEQREVVLLSVCYGYSHSEISERLKLPLGTVKAHVRRGLLLVRTAIERAEGRP